MPQILFKYLSITTYYYITQREIPTKLIIKTNIELKEHYNIYFEVIQINYLEKTLEHVVVL